MTVVVAVAVAGASAGILLKQLLDQPGGFELVELLDALAEPLLRQPFDVVFVELLFGDDLEDQVALLGRAVPALAGTVGWVSIAVAIGGAVGWSGQEADFLDAGVHAVLQQPIQAGGLGGNLGDVGDLGLEGEAELMTAVTGQTDLLGIIAFEHEGHGNPLGCGRHPARHPSGQGEVTGGCLRGWWRNFTLSG